MFFTTVVLNKYRWKRNSLALVESYGTVRCGVPGGMEGVAVGVTNTGVRSGREGDGEAPGGAEAGEEDGGRRRQGEGDPQTHHDHGFQHARLVAACQR